MYVFLSNSPLPSQPATVGLWMDGLTDRLMDRHMHGFPLCSLGLLPCLFQNCHCYNGHTGTARVLLAIYCLWATGFLRFSRSHSSPPPPNSLSIILILHFFGSSHFVPSNSFLIIIILCIPRFTYCNPIFKHRNFALFSRDFLHFAFMPFFNLF